MVKYQLVVDQVTRPTRTAWHSQQDSGLPPSFLEATRSHIQNIRRQLPQELEHDYILVGHYLQAELAINEASVNSSSSTNNPDLYRHQALDAVLNTIQMWFDLFFAIPTAQYIGMTFDFWAQMAHCLISLFHLTVREDPAWDRKSVRSKLDIFSISDQLMRGFDEAANLHQVGVSRDFIKLRDICQSLRDGWLAEINAAAVTVDANPPSNFVNGQSTGPLAVPMDLANDPWLTDIFHVSWD
jgi:hypothetical protein